MTISTCFKQYAGLPLQKHEMELVTEPIVEVGAHNTLKLVQVASVFGVGVMGPLLAMYQPGLSWSSVIRHSGRCGRAALIAGLALGPFVTYTSTRNLSQDELQRWCQDVRQSERLVDRASLGGLAGGLAVAKYVGVRPALNGAAFGILGGLLVGELMSLMVQPKTTAKLTR